MAEMNDYPVDEARVMRGEDDRIASAVESAVAMGFDADVRDGGCQARDHQAPPAARTSPRPRIDALLSDIGGGERALQLPSVMPHAIRRRRRRRRRARRRERFTRHRPHRGLPEGSAATRREKHPSTRAKGKPSRSRSSPWTTTTETARTTERPTPPPGGGTSLMAQLAAERRAREEAPRRAPAPRGPFSAAHRVPPAGDASRAALVGSGGSGGGGSGRLALTGAAARAAAGATAISGPDTFGGSGIVDALLSGVAPLTVPPGGGSVPHL